MSARDKLRAAWLAALRSGKYNRIRACLRQGNAFCASGLLCELYRKQRKSKFVRWEVGPNSQEYFFRYGKNYTSYTLTPFCVSKAVGLSLYDMAYVAQMNDTGVSWPEIADWLEHNFANKKES